MDRITVGAEQNTKHNRKSLYPPPQEGGDGSVSHPKKSFQRELQKKDRYPPLRFALHPPPPTPGGEGGDGFKPVNHEGGIRQHPGGGTTGRQVFVVGPSISFVRQEKTIWLGHGEK